MAAEMNHYVSGNDLATVLEWKQLFTCKEAIDNNATIASLISKPGALIPENNPYFHRAVFQSGVQMNLLW